MEQKQYIFIGGCYIQLILKLLLSVLTAQSALSRPRGIYDEIN